ncbi:MAG: D-alanyl-D-alanine carboxypeptidase family protein [Acetivibrionales bacterium]
MKAQKFTLYTLILVFLFLCLPVSAFAAAPPELSAEAYILIDMETGQVLAEKNADARRSPASTTKIMTALVALENASLEDEMTASADAINSVPYDYVRAGIKIGETMKFSTLLDLMLITSANEASNIIAENISPDGTMQGFTDLMNQKAADLGLKSESTHFTNSSGLEEETHYTTARDLAIISRAAMQNDIFREVVKRTEFTMPDTNLRKSSEWQVGHLAFTNKLLISRSTHYSEVTGIKTGYTDLAGLCLVSSAVNPDGLELISVVLGAQSEKYQFGDSQALLEHGFKNFRKQQLVQKGEYVAREEVEDAVDGKKVEIETNGELSYILPENQEERENDLTDEITYFESPFKAPIEAGQVLGKKEYFYKGKSIGSVELVAKDSIEKTTIAILRDKYRQIISDKRFIFGVKAAAGAILVILILIFILRLVNRRRKRRYGSYYPYKSKRRKYRSKRFR